MHTCTSCGRTIRTMLRSPWLVTCTTCKIQVLGNVEEKGSTFEAPDDFSAIQIGTKGTYKGKGFTITGRVRLQMATDYLNLWSAHYDGGPLWIGQSLEKMGFFPSEFVPYPEGMFNEPRAGLYVNFSPTIKLKCEQFEPCIDMRFEGELQRFPYLNIGFDFIQATNTQGNTALILHDVHKRTEFLWGELSTFDLMGFSNLRTFDDWK